MQGLPLSSVMVRSRTTENSRRRTLASAVRSASTLVIPRSVSCVVSCAPTPQISLIPIVDSRRESSDSLMRPKSHTPLAPASPFLAQLFAILARVFVGANPIDTGRLGLPVSIGFAPTKTLAKMANNCAKKGLAGANGVCDFGRMSESELSRLLSTIGIREIWGVGAQLTTQLTDRGITSVEALRTADAKVLRREFSVVLERTITELNGSPCIDMEDSAPNKQQIMSSRSFGDYVTELEPLNAAVASFIAIAAEKLRSQGSVAGMINVFIRTNTFAANQKQYQPSVTLPIPEPTSDTLALTSIALKGLKGIFKPGYSYKKAGITLMDL